MNEKKRSEATSFLGHWMFRVGYWVFSKDTTHFNPYPLNPDP